MGNNGLQPGFLRLFWKNTLAKDNLVLGLILGFIAPFLGIVGFYFAKFSSLSFSEFLQVMVMWKSFFTSVITVSLIADGVVFTIYTNTDRDITAKGVFIATLIYAVISLTLKYFI